IIRVVSSMALRACRSTLFPYTTLFRSRRAREGLSAGERRRRRKVGREDERRWAEGARRADLARGERARSAGRDRVSRSRPADRRSEEHTSELQSQSNLVCRLLPEKKKH